MAHHWQSPGASASPGGLISHHQGATAVPTYEYACTNPEGKHEFEVVQSFSDAPVSECPQCGAPVRKVYGSVGVVFKGSGFYRTDSRAAASASESGSSNNSSAKKDSSSAKDSTSSSSTSSSTASSSTASPSTGGGSKAAS
jgi:putative FmdB family regulatory protein